MKPKSVHIAHLSEINLAVLFISTSGALGRYIELPVPVTIGSRAIIAFFILWLYCRYRKVSFRVESKDRLPIFLSGFLMGLHWITYFYALHLSNVAIGMLSLFTFPILTAFLEPLLLKTKFQRVHFLLGLLVLTGIYFLVPNFDLKNDYTLAVVIGVLSALFYALRNLLLKSKVTAYDGSMLMCYQVGIVAMLLIPALFFFDLSPISSQWPALVVLAILTTALGHTLFLRSFKNFSITTVSIISSVQPVYGILIGALFLKEIPTLFTIVGGLLILSSVVIESLRSYRG